MFINKTAAQRILSKRFGWLPIIDKVWCFGKSVCILYRKKGEKVKGRLALHSDQFLKDGMEFRSSVSNKIPHMVVALDTDTYTVQFEGRDKHTVDTNPKSIFCDCKDFEQQLEAYFQGKIGFNVKPICSHLFAVSKHLGFSTFGEMVKSKKLVSVAA